MSPATANPRTAACTRPASLSAHELVESSTPAHALMNGRVAKSRSLTPEPSKKRRIDTTYGPDLLPAKRARSTRSDTQRPGVEIEKAGLAAKQPNPVPSKRSYASFLEGLVDPPFSNPRPEPGNRLVSGWLESVYGPDRERHCLSDSHLDRSDDNGQVSRSLTKSAPPMGNTRDGDGYVVPLTPTTSYSESIRTDTGSGLSSSRSSALVEDAVYRSVNLRENHIHLRSQYDEFPDHIATLVAVARKGRESPGPSLEELRQDTTLESLELGVGEPEVEDYFRENILPSKLGGSLKRSDRQPMLKHAVPNEPRSKFRVSNPVPDMLYGYSRSQVFSAGQQIQLGSMGKQVQANNLDLIYPFFVLEFKGDGPAGTGSMWVATNQCLGGSATCVNMADRLNRQLRQCEDTTVREVNTAAFSVATNGIEARLFVSWKQDDLEFYMQKIDSFLLQKPEHYLEFRKHVRNIVDWGKNQRLQEIRDSLDVLLEESRKKTSEAAKSRPPPSDGSVTSSGRKRKPSSSRSRGAERQGDGAAEPS